MHELPNTKALIAVVGGDAIAAGQHTLTSGLVHNFAEDRGGYSIAMGEAVFEASAQSPAQGGAAAAATTFLDVSGADFVIEMHSDHKDADRNHAWASSELDYVAIVIDGGSPPAGPVVIDPPQPGNHLQPCWHEPLSAHVPIDVNGWSPRGGPVVIEFPQSGDHLLSHTHEPPHGNNADVLAMAEAHGAGSLSATLTNALTIENHFSFVNASAMVVI